VPTISLEEAQSHLAEVIANLTPDQPVIITRNNTPVARLVAEPPPKRQPRKAGNCKGMLVIVADDDEHLEDFAEYME
jgi:prevent-host-death family protein